jgi:acetolactate decarboxylase
MQGQAPQASAPAAAADGNQKLVQVSTINALIKGIYEGDTTIGELRKHGSFGIGTFNHLDGEMLALDGTVYQVTGDGKVHVVPDSVKTPFASVTNFQANTTTPSLNADSYEALKKMVDAGLPSENLFYAVKVSGSFPQMKVRSVPRQAEPYRPLTEVVKEQSVFDYADTSGTLVGFRCPDYVQGVNVADYHMHFISSDKAQGGHVLGFKLKDGTVEVDQLSDFRLLLPQDQEFMAADLSSGGDEAIHKVEKLTGR